MFSFYKFRKVFLINFLFILLVFLSITYLYAFKCKFKDFQYSFQTLRTMGYSSTGGADIGECLSTIEKIKEGDNESWYLQWYKTASRVEKMADDFLAKGHKISAKEAYFRASNYYRTAEFFLHTNIKDPRIIKTWKKSRQCFLKASKLSKRPIKLVRIPYKNTTLPAYLCLVDNSNKKRPLLIVHSGFDGTAEELYFEIGHLALKRGFNCLLFEGPGQGEVLRLQNIPFRPDWENVVSPVVDYALTLPQVDSKRIALIGFSFGGYLAPRAVAFEHRIKACVADGGVYDFYENAIKKCPPDIKEILKSKKESEKFNKIIFSIMNKDIDVGWFFANGMYTFAAKTPTEFLKKLKPYNMRKYAKNIKCDMLVVDSQDDKDMPGQAKQLFNALKCRKEYLLFTNQQGAGQHCQMSAIMISNEKILNWLEDKLKR